MTREETIKVIGIITTAYPNFDKFRDEKHIRSMVAIWADMFSEDDAGLVALAVKEHISTSKWPPSIAEIREIMTRIAHPDIIPPDEAWEVVSKYLDTEGEYNHGDIYRALPRTIAEAVDSIGYGQLYAMHVAYARGHAAKAGLDRVAFMQAYEDKVERQRRKAMLPGSLRQKIEAVSAGLDSDVAQQIFRRKAAGIQTYGSTTVAVLSSSGVTYNIKFSRPTLVPVWIKVTDLETDANRFPVDGKDQIAQALIDYIGSDVKGGTTIGETVYYNRLPEVIYTIPGVLDFTLQTSPDGSDYGTYNIEVDTREKAYTEKAKVSVS